MTEKIRRRASSKGRTLDLIRSSGPISRVELAELTGLTQATISTVVRELLTDGVISETGRGESTGGKPRMRLEINPASRLGIGVHIGQDYITYIVADLAGTVVGRKRVDGPGDDSPVSVVARMTDDIESLIVGLDLDRHSLVGMGLAMPGPIDRIAGTVRGVPSLLGWTEFPIRRALATTTGLQVELDNDATAAAIGEYWLGATVGYGSYASVYMGSGIGSGIVVDGTIYHGLSANVGEIGHVTVDARGPLCPCGNFGCLELFAGPRAIMNKATDAVARGELDIPLTGKTSVDFAALGTAAARGDATASALIQESADYMASAIVSMVNLFDLPLIVLAGNAFSTTGSIYVRTITRVLAERAMVRDIHPIEVRVSVNGNDAAALGAATLVLQERLSPRSLRSVAP
ncbi:ROK family transcriptional regulator [Mycetocola zhujimingii]|uniref:Sugar kinase n=1 Tax=Mycetocola zhujimingii TaxID=2079792 RepID=A0A2U1TAL9_9MICO|nr:ROK family transcriptional regulator [Mycetocola zhujimingii]PWC04647.1 sugar kinase [Mycetocola zhujimingii]